jgi:hypothetical protein
MFKLRSGWLTDRTRNGGRHSRSPPAARLPHELLERITPPSTVARLDAIAQAAETDAVSRLLQLGPPMPHSLDGEGEAAT